MPCKKGQADSANGQGSCWHQSMPTNHEAPCTCRNVRLHRQSPIIGCCDYIQEEEQVRGTLGAAVAAGVLTAPRLQTARLPAPTGDLHLVPRPRGAFSNLVAVPVAG